MKQDGATTLPDLRSKRERQSAEIRERLFNAAIELFAERGLDGVTIGDITDRADVGKGTFFNHFSNKEAVLTHFGVTQLERLQRAIRDGRITGSPSERIVQLLILHAQHPALTPDLARGLFVAHLNNPQVAELDNPNIWHVTELITELLVEGRDAGELRFPGDAREMALFIYGQFFLAMLAWATGFAPEPLPETVERYVCLALNGLRP
ncbi:MAG: TetR/AcrR family transcriptional regulator [Armatimonadota bacterium]